MALTSLTSEWRDWLIMNAARHCERKDLISDLTQKGGYRVEVAEKAFEDAWDEIARCAALQRLINGQRVRPEIVATSNYLDIDGKKINILMTCDVPRVVLLENVLSSFECDELIALAKERIQLSKVVDADSGENALHAARSSSGAFFSRGENVLISNLEKRLAQLCDWSEEYGEGLQVLRYEIGEEYKAHYDWFNPCQSGSRKHLAQGGQRVGTFVMYLSEVEQGGGTRFPNIGLEVKPKKGSAVFFTNICANGIPDRQSFHAGMPVISGVKFIATKWLRESPNVTNNVV